MNIMGLAQYLTIETPIASVMLELTVPITTYAGLPTEATEGDLLYVSDKQANYIYTGSSGWLEVATGTPTGNYLLQSGGTLTGALTVDSSITLANANPIFLDNTNNWLQGNSGSTFYGSNCDGLNFMAEASKNAGAFFWGIDPPGGGGRSIMGLFSNSNGTCLKLTETPGTGMGLSMIEDTATGVSYNCTLALAGSHANMLVQGLGIFLGDCPINVMQGAGPHILISGNGAANNIQTSISFPNPNPASTGPSVLNVNVLLLEGPQTVNGATTFTADTIMQVSTSSGDPILTLSNTYSTTTSNYTTLLFEVSPYNDFSSTATSGTGPIQIGVINPMTGSSSNDFCFSISQSFVNNNMFCVYPNPGVTGIPFQVTVNKTSPDNSGPFIFCTDGNVHVQDGYLMVDDSINIPATSNQLVLGTTNTNTIDSITPAASRTYTIPDVDGNANFIMSAGNQTLSGSLSMPDITIDNTTVNRSSSVTSATISFPGMSDCYILTLRAQASIIAESGFPSLNTTYTNFNISSTIGYTSMTGVFSISFMTPLYSPSGSKPIINVIPIGLGKACYTNINGVVVDTSNNCTGFGVQIWVPGGTTSDAFDFFVQVIC